MDTTDTTETGQPRRGPGRPSNAERAAMNAARNNPVTTENNVNLESADMMPAEFDDAVDFRQFTLNLSMPPIEVVSEREFKTTAEQEAFMQDMMVISINKTGDKAAPPVVAARLNGVGGWFPRGGKIKMPRGLVGVLLQSQERHFATERNQDPNADEGMVTKQNTTPCYPINILWDPRPQLGARWARRIMREGC